MKISASLRIAPALLALTFAAGAVAADVTPHDAPSHDAALPGDSIYQIDVPLVDQDGHTLTLGERSGGPVVISMFYSTCPYMCPMIIDTIKRVDHALKANGRARLRVVMVSFDSANDTPPVLKASAVKHHVDFKRWTFARAEPDGVRSIAAALDIQYRALPDGSFNHSGVLTLLDAQGRIVARTEKLGEVDPEFLKAVVAQTQPSQGPKPAH
ncbi:MAG: SCO family protein [Rhodanobacter sp.]|jgi:protein SCO1/2|nr:SCO family protein [Rhodanobacter sp.]